MKLYRTINRYILERFPLLWTSHFIWITLVGIFLHFLFWSFAHSITDVDLLKEYYVESYFYKSGFLWMYIIIEISILIFFGFRFFNHHPFRNFYPVGKFYFAKQSILIGTMLVLHLTVPFAFEQGMKDKGYNIINQEKEARDVQLINRSYPFLFSDISNYYLTNKAYPAPFPLKEISDFTIGYDTTNDVTLTHGIDYNQPYVTLNKHEYQFAVVRDTTIHCEVNTEIKRIVDVSKVEQLSELSILNFASVFIPYGRHESFESDSILPYIHRVYNSNNKEELTRLLSELKQLCEEYHISNSLDPAHMTRLIFEQDLNKKQLIKVEARAADERDGTNYPAEVVAESSAPPIPTEINAANKIYETLRMNRIEMTRGNFYADIGMIRNVIQNLNGLERVGYVRIPDNFFIYLIILLSIVLFFVFVKHIQVSDLLMGLLYTFLVTTSFVILNMVLENKAGIDYLQVGLVYLIIFLFASMYVGFRHERLSKRNNMRLFLPVSIGLQIFLPFLFYYFQDLTKVYVKDPCTLEGNRTPIFEIVPWHLFVMQLISYIVIFRYLRALHASKE